MKLNELLIFIKDRNIPLDSEVIVRIDTLRDNHNNSIEYTECDTIYTEHDCYSNPRIILSGVKYEPTRKD